MKKNKKNNSSQGLDLFSDCKDVVIFNSTYSSISCNQNTEQACNSEIQTDNGYNSAKIINLGEHRRKMVINFVLNNTKSF